MAPELKLVVRLQDLDNRIRELQREIATLPKHLSEIERTLESHVRKLEADRAALAANHRERKNLDGDIQEQESRISKLKDQMTGTKITNEQYRAFQKEIDYCQKEIRRAEDRILGLMEESEPLDQNVQAAESALVGEKAKVEEEQQLVRARTAEDERLLQELQSERATAVVEVSAAVYALYERVRAKRRGLAVAEAVDGRCSACHMALRPQFYQELRVCQEVMCCESCGRILYYNPPVSFEDIAAARSDAPAQP